MSELRPAPHGYPIKLVRDRTPDIINPSGASGELFYGALNDKNAKPWLQRKLMEEAAEYLLEPGIEELADVLAVVDGLAHIHGFTIWELLGLMGRDERGGFRGAVMMYGRHEEFDGCETDP